MIEHIKQKNIYKGDNQPSEKKTTIISARSADADLASADSLCRRATGIDRR